MLRRAGTAGAQLLKWVKFFLQKTLVFTAIFTPEEAFIDSFHIMKATRQVVAINLAKLHTFKAKILCIVSLPMPDLFLVSVPARCLASPPQLCSVFALYSTAFSTPKEAFVDTRDLFVAAFPQIGSTSQLEIIGMRQIYFPVKVSYLGGQ